jgi:hypothetical protein
MPEAFDTAAQQDDTADPFDQDQPATAGTGAGVVFSADQAVVAVTPPLHDDDALSGQQAAVTTDILQPETGAVTAPARAAPASAFDVEEDPFDAEASEHLAGVDRREDDKPRPDAVHAPVSASRKLLDDFAFLTAREEAPPQQSSPEQPTPEQADAGQPPAEGPPVRMLVGDPAQDTFASWLRKWRDGQGS